MIVKCPKCHGSGTRMQKKRGDRVYWPYKCKKCKGEGTIEIKEVKP